MESQIPWYLSKTIWASLVILITSLLGPFGINIGGDTQNEIVDNIMALVIVISALVAIYGRVSATKIIIKNEGEQY